MNLQQSQKSGETKQKSSKGKLAVAREGLHTIKQGCGP
jgi:hypothetical protein